MSDTILSDDSQDDDAATTGVRTVADGPDGSARMLYASVTGDGHGLGSATGPADHDGLSSGGLSGGGLSREALERAAARQRGADRRRAREMASAEAREVSELQALDLPHATRAAERAFPALVEHVRDYAIFLLDPDGIITQWGQGARLMEWWTQDEAVGAHLRMLYLDGGSEDGTAEDHLVVAEQIGESVSEGHRVRRDGSMFWAGVTLTALRESDGTLVGFAKVTRDLTAKRAADAALAAAVKAEQARAAAEAVSAAKSQFVATMSHEIRTPINAVLGYADLLAAEIAGPLTAEQQAFVERLRSSARHLLGLVEDVLDLSRLDAGAELIRPSVGRLEDVVSAALALVEPQARQRGVELIGDVRTQAEGLSYVGDEARVRQILVNLLANAVRFAAPRAGAPGRVTVSTGVATRPIAVELSGMGPWNYVCVEDTGPGIPEDQLGAIFEPFVQVGRSSSNPVDGAGLGLTISRRLARGMGGQISVESTLGAGSAFVLWLPVARLEAPRTGAGA